MTCPPPPTPHGGSLEEIATMENRCENMKSDLEILEKTMFEWIVLEKKAWIENWDVQKQIAGDIEDKFDTINENIDNVSDSVNRIKSDIDQIRN